MVDHKNLDGLNNTRENLRVVSKSFNSQNRAKRPDTSSQYIGVRLKKGRWNCQCAGVSLGSYDTEERAAEVYDGAALRRWGPDARTNGLGSVHTLPREAVMRDLPTGVHRKHGRLVVTDQSNGNHKTIYCGDSVWDARVAYEDNVWANKYAKLEALVNAPIRRNDSGVAMVPCGESAFALVDDADYHRFMRVVWRLSWHNYAESSLGLMHRLVHKGDLIDHINGDRLDNRRCNLRVATRSENAQNSRNSKRGASGYLGVCRTTTDLAWTASISCNRRSYFLGNFQDPVDAAKAYDAKALELYEKPALNFPPPEVVAPDKRQELLAHFMSINGLS